VIFYHAGNFFSRDNIGPGMMSFHPSALRMDRTPRRWNPCWPEECDGDEYAVMLDARDALDVDPAAAKIERGDYADSWMTGAK